jgi:hypothetical protein
MKIQSFSLEPYRSWQAVVPDIDGALVGNVRKHLALLEVLGSHHASQTSLSHLVDFQVGKLQAERLVIQFDCCGAQRNADIFFAETMHI